MLLLPDSECSFGLIQKNEKIKAYRLFLQKLRLIPPAVVYRAVALAGRFIAIAALAP